MRLLAATAGDAAQGRRTEAQEIVGRISVGGTIGFVVFAALFFGLATGAIYLLIRRWLPSGRLGGLSYGALLLVLAGTRIEPLRPGNRDFDIVGPGWLAVAVFGALVVLHGMLVAALAGRYSTVAPLPSFDRRSFATHAPLALLLPAAPILVPIAAVGVVAVALSRVQPLLAFLRSRRTSVIGRVVLAPAPPVRRLRLQVHPEGGPGDGPCGSYQRPTKEPITVTRDQIIHQRRVRVLEHAGETGNVAQTCRVFGISRKTFYEWRKLSDAYGLEALMPKARRAHSWPTPHRPTWSTSCWPWPWPSPHWAVVSSPTASPTGAMSCPRPRCRSSSSTTAWADAPSGWPGRRPWPPWWADW